MQNELELGSPWGWKVVKSVRQYPYQILDFFGSAVNQADQFYGRKTDAVLVEIGIGRRIGS